MRKFQSHRERFALAFTCYALVVALGLCAVFTITASSVDSAHANIFTKMLREAGEAGGKSTRHGVDFPGGTARVVAKLPTRPGRLALAAHVNPDGHWKFANASGEVFTAATPEEMARVVKTLAPSSASSNPKLSLYLDEATLFERAQFLDKLPKASAHHIVVGKQSFAVDIARAGAGGQSIAHVRPNVVVPLTARKTFEEAIWQLSRPLNKADIRVLSLRPGARATLSPSPRFDKTTRQAMVDVIDPDALVQAMSSVRGQTLLVSGEVRDNILHYVPASGGERSLNIVALRDAARNADVNLIVLQSRSPRQPGGRNWLWQTVEVGGLKEALNRASFADFLNALGAGGSGKFRVSVTPQGNGRTIVEAIAQPQSVTVPYSDVVGGWLGDVVSNVTGNVVMDAVSADVRDKARQQELDNRILPGIPSIIQMFYVGSIIMGLLAWTVSREVWAMIWPSEQRSEYRSGVGYFAARIIKFLVFFFVFLPIAGIPMLVLSVGLQIWTVLGWIWAVLTSPVRFWRWMRKGRV